MLNTDDRPFIAAAGDDVDQPCMAPREACVKGDNSEAETPTGPAEAFTFGRRLRRERMARQWSQLQLAHRIREAGAARRGAAELESLLIMISKWENNWKTPNQYSLHLIAAALDVPVDSLGLPVDRDFVF